jgi:hypothetical protein
MNRTETVLYGLPEGATERYQEALLLTNANPDMIETCKGLAARDGYHSFRTATIDLTRPPDFAGTVNLGRVTTITDAKHDAMTEAQDAADCGGL